MGGSSTAAPSVWRANNFFVCRGGKPSYIQTQSVEEEAVSQVSEGKQSIQFREKIKSAGTQAVCRVSQRNRSFLRDCKDLLSSGDNQGSSQSSRRGLNPVQPFRLPEESRAFETRKGVTSGHSQNTSPGYRLHPWRLAKWNARGVEAMRSRGERRRRSCGKVKSPAGPRTRLGAGRREDGEIYRRRLAE